MGNGDLKSCFQFGGFLNVGDECANEDAISCQRVGLRREVESNGNMEMRHMRYMYCFGR
jgi:hypothetical protein